MIETLSSFRPNNTRWLQGNISEKQPITNLVQYLTQNQAQSCLQIHHPVYGSITIHFEHGKVQHCAFGTLEGESALKKALSLRHGRFQVVHTIPTPKKTINRGLDAILLDLYHRQNTKLSLYSRVQADHNAMDNTIRISLQEITLLRHLPKMRTLGEVAKDLKLEGDKVIAIAEKLLARGLIRQPPRRENYFSNSFFTDLQHLCTNFLGPLSSLALDEVMDAINCKIDTIPIQKHRSLGKLIAKYVPDTEHPSFVSQYNQLVQSHMGRKQSA